MIFGKITEIVSLVVTRDFFSLPVEEVREEFPKLTPAEGGVKRSISVVDWIEGSGSSVKRERFLESSSHRPPN